MVAGSVSLLHARETVGGEVFGLLTVVVAPPPPPPQAVNRTKAKESKKCHAMYIKCIGRKKNVSEGMGDIQ